MNILQINTRYIGGGGAAYIANELHRNINENTECNSKFLYGRGAEGDENSVRITYPKGEIISAAAFRLFSKEININKDMEQYIKKCDVVHLHNIHGYFINFKKLFSLIKKYNKPVVWTLHDMWPITGRCAYSFGCTKWKEHCGNCENKNSYPKTMMDRSESELKLKKEIIGSLNKDKLVVVTPSKWLADICRKSYLNKFNIVDIPNGIETIDIKEGKSDLRKKYKLDENKKVVLFVAADANDERKGIKYILDIIPQCKDYIFVSIGKKIEGFNEDNFIQCGYIKDRKVINEIYKMADIFVIPSLDDNFPTTVLEAFSNGTPVIGFNQGGIPEQIGYDSGVVVNEVSSKALKQKLVEVLEDNDLCKIYSRNAKEKFEREYSIGKFIDRYMEVYKKLEDSNNESRLYN